MAIDIKYNGKFPNLCSGHLIVTIDEKEWDFGTHCLLSGGSAFVNGSEEGITSGEWSIPDWPLDFPTKLKSLVLEEINRVIRHGCCGGCI
jgi:hypothetical protein